MYVINLLIDHPATPKRICLETFLPNLVAVFCHGKAKSASRLHDCLCCFTLQVTTKLDDATIARIGDEVKVIRHQRPRVQWIQTFADERCGKNGGLYQACSFLYCGFHVSEFYEIDGTWIHKSMMDRPSLDKRGWRSGPKVAWAKQNRARAKRHEFRQFRYIKFLDGRARGRLLLPVLPYPKDLT